MRRVLVVRLFYGFASQFQGQVALGGDARRDLEEDYPKGKDICRGSGLHEFQVGFLNVIPHHGRHFLKILLFGAELARFYVL